MAEFLNTTGVSYWLENVIEKASERLVLVSPYLRVNDRIRELLIDKDRLKLDVRVIYGKNELRPQEVEWMKALSYLRTSFCENLHAKCYMSEEAAIMTSMNLYEFSQVHNNEMGILVRKSEDEALYQDIWEEVSRLIRASEEVRLSAERVTEQGRSEAAGTHPESAKEKLTTSALSKRVGFRKACEAEAFLEKMGYLQTVDGKYKLTPAGEKAGAEWGFSPKKGGTYFLWPESVVEECEKGKS